MFEDLIPELQEPASSLLHAAGAAGLQPRVTSTRRTRAAQARLYRRWQSGLSPFPAAPPGLSAHEYGFAFDMVVVPMEALSDVGYTWQSWGGVWGSQNDPVHFEFPGFVAPTGLDQYTGENLIQRAASWFNDLPWYAQLWIPISATTRQRMTAQELERGNPTLFHWLQKTFGITSGTSGNY